MSNVIVSTQGLTVLLREVEGAKDLLISEEIEEDDEDKSYEADK